MSSKIERTNYFVNEVLFEKSAEQGIDCDITLPDYCADISRILRCFACPNVTSSSISGDRIVIDGTVLIRLLYVSDGKIFSHEHICQYSKQIDINCDTIGAVLEVSSCVQYVNCRAVNSRRVEVHGAFVITSKVSACKSREVIDDISDDGMEIRKDSIMACSASGNAGVSTPVTQVIDIGTDRPQIKSIIRNSAVPSITETKQVTNKVLIKGELKIKTLYKSENDSIECIENVLPVSQIMDIEGVDEKSTVDIKASLSSLDVMVKPSALGSMSLLDISAVISFVACSYNCMEFPVVTDAYSTGYGSECTFKNVNVDKIAASVNKAYVHTFSIEAGQDVCRVEDMWCEGIKCRAGFKDEKLVFSGTLTGFAITEDAQGNIALRQGDTEYSFDEDVGEIENLRCSPDAVITGCDYTIGETTIDVRVNIKICAVVFDNYRAQVVDDVAMSEKPIEKSSSLFIYYSQKGEKLWDIARRYNTTVRQIMDENELDDEILAEEKPLLIWSK